jgi:hypothetical protein
VKTHPYSEHDSCADVFCWAPWKSALSSTVSVLRFGGLGLFSGVLPLLRRLTAVHCALLGDVSNDLWDGVASLLHSRLILPSYLDFYGSSLFGFAHLLALAQTILKPHYSSEIVDVHWLINYVMRSGLIIGY